MKLMAVWTYRHCEKGVINRQYENKRGTNMSCRTDSNVKYRFQLGNGSAFPNVNLIHVGVNLPYVHAPEVVSEFS